MKVFVCETGGWVLKAVFDSNPTIEDMKVLDARIAALKKELNFKECFEAVTREGKTMVLKVFAVSTTPPS